MAIVVGCAGQATVATERGEAKARFTQIVPGMSATQVARLGERAYALCKTYQRMDKLEARRTCRWAYLYTSVACNRGQRRSCLLAGLISRRNYGKNSRLALQYFRTGCARNVRAACAAVKAWQHPFAKPPPPQPRLKVVKRTNCIDEVACLLASNPPKCCRSYYYRRRIARSGPTRRRLTRRQIMRGMSRIRGPIKACGSQHAGKGTVIVRMRIGASGFVTSARATRSPTPALGRCVANTIRGAARFKRARMGRSLTYPFVFR